MATKSAAYNINRLTQTTDILRVRSAATTICIHRAPAGAAARSVLTREEVAGPAGVAALESAASATDDARVPTLFGEEQSVEFTSGWQLLMQQRSVRNWLRSTPASPAVMRYPGEYSFPGGGIEDGEGAEAAARRELSEELRAPVPPEAVLRLLSVKQCALPPPPTHTTTHTVGT